MKQKTTLIPVRLPPELQSQFGKAVFNDNYGFKGKSRWVEEAVISLLNLGLNSYADLVSLDETLTAQFKADKFSLSEDTRNKLDDTLIKLREKCPSVNITLSSIVRTAILQRLLRGISLKENVLTSLLSPRGTLGEKMKKTK
jgi:hypothetical protein